MKKFTKETIEEVEKIYGKASKAEIEQAEIILNNPDILANYYEEEEKNNNR
jgi:hypothetical protein